MGEGQGKLKHLPSLSAKYKLGINVKTTLKSPDIPIPLQTKYNHHCKWKGTRTRKIHMLFLMSHSL